MAKLSFALAIGAALAFQVKADDVALITELAPNIHPGVIEEAVGAMKCAQSRGVNVDARRLTIIDYTLPSRKQRL